MSDKVSPATLAKHLGVSYAAVTTAINKGRLHKSVQRTGTGRYIIDLAQALTEWSANTDVAKSQNAYIARNKTHSEKTEKSEAIKSATITKTGIPSFSESRAIKEAYLARLAKLEYEERLGQFISADKVKVEAFKIARTVRDALLNIPERISAELAAETDSYRVHQRLKEELVLALQELIRGSD